MRALFRLALLGTAALLGFAGFAASSRMAAASDSPLNLIADQVGYDQNLGVYVARGHVEMAQDDRIVMADTVTYNERTKRISASGNVVLLLPNGDTTFGNYADVSDDFSNGIVHGFRALLNDKSRVAAASAQQVDNNVTVMKEAVYTPCLPCKTDPKKQPVWQIKAHEVIRDKAAQTVTYHGAWMEMWGVPVVWTPWFQHADFGVKRMTGFLQPTYSVSSGKSGIQLRTPYFWAIGDDKDFTFTPIFRGEGTPSPGGIVGLGEYRQRTENGAFTLEASGTYEDTPDDDESGRELRGHIAGDGLFDLNRDWRWGYTFKNTTDKEYLRQYHLGSSRWLQDQLWTEGFFGRSYFEARGYGWQTTDDDFDNKSAPIVTPLITYDFNGEPGAGGGYWSLNTGIMNLLRREGRDSFRVSMRPSWTLPYTSSWGDVYELNLSLDADMYVSHGVDPNSDEFDPGSNTSTFSGVTGRIFPQGSFKWRYPFVHPGPKVTQIFQPIAQLVLSPKCCNSGKIANEDSRTFEFDDTKLFSANRFTGYDRVDAGSRVNYGVEWNAYTPGGGRADVLIGQSYQFLRPGNQPENSGINQDFSDVVGRVALAPSDLFNATYRFRLDVSDGTMKRQEVTLQAGPPELSGFVTYTQLANNENLSERKQVFAGITTQFEDYWRAHLGASYDLVNSRVNSVNASFGYNDECFGVNFVGQYTPRGDTDQSSGKLAGFLSITFKNLGDIRSSF
jgi:LPS-assembly protein